MPYSFNKGFTLAELLVALAILGIIATFTIPKLLTTQRDQRWNAAYKEAVSMVSGSYTLLKQERGIQPSTDGLSLTPYMNYVAIGSGENIDQIYNTAGTTTCSSGCLRLHSGAILRATSRCFYGSSSTNAVTFHFDPDGQVTGDGTAAAPGKAVNIYLYYNGRVTSTDSIAPNTVVGNSSCNAPLTNQPDPATKPDWLSW